MNIRPVTLQDLPSLATIHALAFARMVEPTITTLLHHQARFDPKLSLIAEKDGIVVGHALFIPYTIRLLDQDVEAVNLAPIAVHPDYQKQGIGGALIEEGHRIAKEKGYVLSFLLGHTDYYPRFGYQVYAYGSSTLQTTVNPRKTVSITARAFQPEDCRQLCNLWHQEESKIDFAMIPDATMLDWSSANPTCETMVYLRNDNILGYSRKVGSSIRMFLADDEQTAQEMAIMLAVDNDTVTLPLHPYSASASAFSEQATVDAWKAGMALSLLPSPFEDYMAQVKENKRVVGRVIWHPIFDIGG